MASSEMSLKSGIFSKSRLFMTIDSCSRSVSGSWLTTSLCPSPQDQTYWLGSGSGSGLGLYG